MSGVLFGQKGELLGSGGQAVAAEASFGEAELTILILANQAGTPGAVFFTDYERRRQHSFPLLAYSRVGQVLVVGWLPVLTRPEAAEIVLDSLRFLIREGRLTL